MTSSSSSNNGSRRSGRTSGKIENGCLLVGDISGGLRADGNNVTSRQVCILNPERLATIVEDHLSTLGRHSILSIYENLGRLAIILLMSVKRSLCRGFRLWSNSCQMTTLTVRPIERCRVSRNAVLLLIASVTACNKPQGNMLTSQTTTVLGAHLTRIWKS